MGYEFLYLADFRKTLAAAIDIISPFNSVTQASLPSNHNLSHHLFKRFLPSLLQHYYTAGAKPTPSTVVEWVPQTKVRLVHDHRVTASSLTGHPFAEEDLLFNGDSGAEAERFILGINKQARSAGKLRDEVWKLDLVAASMGGSALRWYYAQPASVTTSWSQLSTAILKQWPNDTDGTSS